MSRMKTPFYSWFGGALVLVIDHPDDVHAVLTAKTCMEKPQIYKFFNMGKSLFTAPGGQCKSPLKQTFLLNDFDVCVLFKSENLETTPEGFKPDVQSENIAVVRADLQCQSQTSYSKYRRRSQ